MPRGIACRPVNTLDRRLLRPLPFRPLVAVWLLAAAIAVLIPAAPARGIPLTAEMRSCVAAVDRGTSTLASAQASLLGSCLSRSGRGQLGDPPGFAACVAADARGTLSAKKPKAISLELASCAPLGLPTFGAPALKGGYLPPPIPGTFDPNTHETFTETTLPAVPEAARLLVDDLFGAPVDTALLLSSGDRAGAACQQSVAKAMLRCAQSLRSEFLRCKKRSLSRGAMDAAALETECMTDGGSPTSGFPDPRGRLARTCGTALARTIDRRCTGIVPTTLTGSCSSAGDPAACLADRVACRVCQESNSAGGLSRDCDLLDDGVGNGSCAPTVPVCGNDLLDQPGEQCDDGNTLAGDCCSPTCEFESIPSTCAQPQIVLDTPLHGSFTTATQVTVTGHVANVNRNDAAVTLNGAPVVLAPDKTFSAVLPLLPARVFNPILGRVTRVSDGERGVDQVVAIAGRSTPLGGPAEDGLALRLDESVFDPLEATLSGLVPPIDLSGLLPPGTPLLDDFCYATLFGGCIGSIDVSVGASPSPGIGGVGADIDSNPGRVDASILIEDLSLPLDIQSVTGVPISCSIGILAPTVAIRGQYGLAPLASDPTQIDVAQIGAVTIPTPAITTTSTCAGLPGALVGTLANLLVGQLISQVGAAALLPLNQVDGNGNTPIAALLETTLGLVDLPAVLGPALGLDLDAPFTAINEDVNGITFAADLTATALSPAPGAPSFTATYRVPESFPVFGATTPVGSLPYGGALALSTSAMNQLLRAQTEQGLLAISVGTVDLGGGPVALTAGALAPALPEFAALAPATPLTLRTRPTLAPVLTGASGPGGELGEMRFGHLLLEVVESAGLPGETVHLAAALDSRFGIDLASGPGGLTFAATSPLPGDTIVAVLDNPLGVDEPAVEALLPVVFDDLLPTLTGTIGTIPLPAFLTTGVEIARNPYYAAFASVDLVP